MVSDFMDKFSVVPVLSIVFPCWMKMKLINKSISAGSIVDLSKFAEISVPFKHCWSCIKKITDCWHPVNITLWYCRLLPALILPSHNTSWNTPSPLQWRHNERLKSPASWLSIQPFVQAQVKENIKAPRHWPLWGEFTGDRWIPRTKG